MSGEPAFPHLHKYEQQEAQLKMYPGITKRELFAAMAMQGLCADYGRTACAPENVRQNLAYVAVRIANALILELEK